MHPTTQNLYWTQSRPDDLDTDEAVDWMYVTPDVIDRRTAHTDPTIDLMTLSPVAPDRAARAVPESRPVRGRPIPWASLAAFALLSAGSLLLFAVLLTLGAGAALIVG